MRYNEVVQYLQNLTKRDIKPYDMTKALGGNISKYTYRRDNNGNFSKDEINTLIAYFNTKEFIPNLNQNEENVMLDYYPEIFGSCGNGNFEISQQKELIAVPKKCFFTEMSKVKKYSVINARGNSMQPFLYENDKLIIEHFEGEQIIDNKPYVFCYKNEIFVKRLAKNINQLIITSDNRDYDTIKLTADELNDIIIIGQIVGLMRDLR